jgi:hypothetical protein
MFAQAFGSEQVTLRPRGYGDCLHRADGRFGPYDKYRRGARSALTAEQVRGMSIFFDQARCDKYHEGAKFTFERLR